jgi:hypothetical protein
LLDPELFNTEWAGACAWWASHKSDTCSGSGSTGGSGSSSTGSGSTTTAVVVPTTTTTSGGSTPTSGTGSGSGSESGSGSGECNPSYNVAGSTTCFTNCNVVCIYTLYCFKLYSLTFLNLSVGGWQEIRCPQLDHGSHFFQLY